MVVVANGEHITIVGICERQSVTIGHEKFTLNCFAISLGGFDLMLGVHWLRSLGPILWNFEALTMTFWHADHQVKWRGIGAPDVPFELFTTATS